VSGTELRLADLTRRQLEDLILTEHGLLRRVLEAVREHTKDDWKVRREVERIVNKAQDRRPLRVAVMRAGDGAKERRDRDVADAYWDALRRMDPFAHGPDDPCPGDP